MKRSLQNIEKTARYRERLRKRGFRPIQLWTYDTRTPQFLSMVKEQFQCLKNDSLEADILEFTEAALSEVEDWK